MVEEHNMSRWGARRRRLGVLLALLSTGILPYHQSCSFTARNAVTNGVSNVLTGLTEDVLNALLRPGATSSNNTTSGQTGSTDPFAPPAQI